MAQTLRDIQIALGISPRPKIRPQMKKNRDKKPRAEYGSVQRIAAAHGWKPQRIYDTMRRHNLTLDKAVAKLDAKDTERAVKDITDFLIKSERLKRAKGVNT